MRIPSTFLIISGLAILFSGCLSTSQTSSIINRRAGSALVVLPVEEPFTGRRLIGPGEERGNGWLLGFETPCTVLSPRRYRVPAGTVVCTLQRTWRNIRDPLPFGFEAQAGETYELRLDEIGTPHPITVIELGTGRIASPRPTP